MSALPEPAVETAGDFEIRDHLDGIAVLYAGVANVVMQLSWPGVGYGVVESKVESGQVTRHPFKRFRTTVSYLSVALLGNEVDRATYRRAVNSVHIQVRSDAESAVVYNAFDPELQLWVAACLYYGTRDVVVALHGPLDAAADEALLRHCSRFGTTLQVRPEQWPADRAAFERYWQSAIKNVDIDEVVGDYLRGLLGSTFLPFPLRVTTGRLQRFLNLGFLPPEFRDALGVTWTARDQKRFDRVVHLTGEINRRVPRVVRNFPLNFFLYDIRRRVRTERNLV